MTSAGRRCFYATRVSGEDCEEACRVFSLPPHVFTQLEALGAGLAWSYVATPRPLATPGPKWRNAPPVDTVAEDEFERVVFR